MKEGPYRHQHLPRPHPPPGTPSAAASLPALRWRGGPATLRPWLVPCLAWVSWVGDQLAHPAVALLLAAVVLLLLPAAALLLPLPLLDGLLES